MAWKGKVAKKTPNQDGGVFLLEVEFFDDSAPATILARKQVPIPSSATLAEIQLHVRSEGARERAKFNDLRTLDLRINVGDEVTI